MPLGVCLHAEVDRVEDDLCRELERLLRFDTRKLNHLGPFLGFVREELTELGGREGNAVAPMGTSRVLNLGSARPTMISLLSLSTISSGVFLGAPRPDQELAS